MVRIYSFQDKVNTRVKYSSTCYTFSRPLNPVWLVINLKLTQTIEQIIYAQVFH